MLWVLIRSEYPQHMFLWEVRKISVHFGWKKKHLICSCALYCLSVLSGCLLNLLYHSIQLWSHWSSTKVAWCLLAAISCLIPKHYIPSFTYMGKDTIFWNLKELPWGDFNNMDACKWPLCRYQFMYKICQAGYRLSTSKHSCCWTRHWLLSCVNIYFDNI